MVEEKEAIERLYNMKNKVDVALMNSKYEKGDWLYDDVQGTSDTLRMAINAFEKQEKIKSIITDKKKQYRQGWEEIEQIVKGSDEE